jgi:hypothetical protein
VLALGRIAVRLVDYDVAMFGHCDSKINLEEITVPVAGLRSRHGHMAARYPIAEPFEALHLLLDLGSELGRGFAMVKTDLYRHLHLATSSFETAQNRAAQARLTETGRADLATRSGTTQPDYCLAGSWPILP